jgi:hypothetical protein
VLLTPEPELSFLLLLYQWSLFCYVLNLFVVGNTYSSMVSFLTLYMITNIYVLIARMWIKFVDELGEAMGYGV